MVGIEVGQNDKAAGIDDVGGRNRHSPRVWSDRHRLGQAQFEVRRAVLLRDREGNAVSQCDSAVAVSQYRKYRVAVPVLRGHSLSARGDCDKARAPPGNTRMGFGQSAQFEHAIGAPPAAEKAEYRGAAAEQFGERDNEAPRVRKAEARRRLAGLYRASSDTGLVELADRGSNRGDQRRLRSGVEGAPACL